MLSLVRNFPKAVGPTVAAAGYSGRVNGPMPEWAVSSGSPRSPRLGTRRTNFEDIFTALEASPVTIEVRQIPSSFALRANGWQSTLGKRPPREAHATRAHLRVHCARALHPAERAMHRYDRLFPDRNGCLRISIVLSARRSLP